MKYSELISSLSAKTKADKDTIKTILDSMPELLMTMGVSEKVRTPLGTFFCEERKPKKVQLPNGTWTEAKRLHRVRLKPNSRMQVIVED